MDSVDSVECGNLIGVSGGVSGDRLVFSFFHSCLKKFVLCSKLQRSWSFFSVFHTRDLDFLVKHLMAHPSISTDVRKLPSFVSITNACEV